MNVQLLDKVFIGTGEVKGFVFNQLVSTPNLYLYEVKNGKEKHFEVIKRKQVPICIDFDKKIYSETDFKESYPKANQFGILGWSFYSFNQALKKIDSETRR